MLNVYMVKHKFDTYLLFIICHYYNKNNFKIKFTFYYLLLIIYKLQLYWHYMFLLCINDVRIDKLKF